MKSGHAARRSIVLSLVGVLFFLALPGCKREKSTPSPTPSSPTHTKLTVAAAASVRFALPEIIAKFEEEHDGITVEGVYGASGNLFQQITSKAPFDVFLSADENYAIELVKQRHGVGGSIIRYATGRLALWAPNDSPLDVTKGLAILSDETVKKVAIANPKLAPYGVAAEEALKKAGIYDTLKDKIVLGENIAQTAQFVESGNAQVGLLALSMVVSPGLKEKGKSWTVPETDHAPIIQSGCICEYSNNKAVAEQFMKFMHSEAAREVLKRHGFGIPGE